MTLTERAAYLKGLADGLKLDDSTKEGKILKEVLDALEDMATAITDIEDDFEDLSEYVESIDESLVEVENEVFGDDEDFDDYDDEDDYFEVECPACKETICIDYSMYDEDTIKCPNCGETVQLEFVDECECCSEEKDGE